MKFADAILFNSNPCPIYIFELQTLKMVEVNRAALDRYGYDKDEFLSLTLEDLRPKEDIKRIHEFISNSTLGFGDAGIWRHKTKSGKVLMSAITTQTYEEDGILYNIVFANKLSDDFNTRDTYEYTSSLFKNHLRNTPLLYIEWDHRIHIKNFSRRILDKYDFAVDDLYDKTPEDLITLAARKEDILLIANKMTALLGEGYTQTEFDFQFYDKHHNIVHSHWYNSILRDEKGKVISILSLIDDITETKKTEENLKRQNELVKAVIKSLPGIFYLFDENGHYLQWNKNFEKLLGLSPEEFKNENLLDHYDEEEQEKIRINLKRVLNEGETAFVSHINAGDGSKPAYYLTGVRLSIGNKRYIVGNGFDITEKEKSEAKLHKSLHEKEVLLAEIHHRVKNNLAMISGLLELQKDTVNNLSAQKSLMESILRIHSMALIHEKLYHSSDLARINMNEYIPELAQSIIDAFTLEIPVKLKAEIGDIRLDINQAIPIALVINELITNTMEHAFVNRNRGTINITLKRNGHLLKLEVQDNGLGMDKKYLSDSPATLGLRLIQTFTRQLRGSLQIESDKGTYVSLTFNEENTRGFANALIH